MSCHTLTLPKQCSLAHQLLPPSERTKPEEVEFCSDNHFDGCVD